MAEAQSICVSQECNWRNPWCVPFVRRRAFALFLTGGLGKRKKLGKKCRLIWQPHGPR
jgi:hypothetical protein